MNARRSFSLTLTALVCLLLLVPLVCIWLVNLDIALAAVIDGWSGIGSGFPMWGRAYAESLSVDLSTVSTLVPVLMLLFPFLMSINILREQRRNPDYVYSIAWDPYPDQFPFFLVMLGLTGTLYGLYIGLDVSGVAQLGKSSASADAIRGTIDRLLDGTATALLSSLMGLIGAFLASRPFTWLFRRLAFIPAREDHQPLSETLSTLNRDLMELSHSSRTFSENLSSPAMQNTSECVSEIRDALGVLNASVAVLGDRLSEMSKINSEILERVGMLDNLDKLKTLDKLDQLESIQSEVSVAAPELRKLAENAASWRRENGESNENLLRAVRDNSEQLAELGSGVERMAETIAAMRSDSGGDRAALKSALAKYVGGAE